MSIFFTKKVSFYYGFHVHTVIVLIQVDMQYRTKKNNDFSFKFRKKFQISIIRDKNSIELKVHVDQYSQQKNKRHSCHKCLSTDQRNFLIKIKYIHMHTYQLSFETGVTTSAYFFHFIGMLSFRVFKYQQKRKLLGHDIPFDTFGHP